MTPMVSNVALVKLPAGRNSARELAAVFFGATNCGFKPVTAAAKLRNLALEMLITRLSAGQLPNQ
jgi:hypothetical protein